MLVIWRLDRLGRNLRHLIVLLEELHALGIAFVSLNEGIDATTPAGKLQMHILGAIAEFEREGIEWPKVSMAEALEAAGPLPPFDPADPYPGTRALEEVREDVV